MCNCILTTEKRFKEELSLKNENYKDIKIQYANFENKMIGLKDGKVRFLIPINIEGTKLSKKGKEVKVKKTEYLMTDYCPFCGDELVEESVVNE
ncbi:hypothetical protein CIW83_09415 [Tissierella sp. P1]|uniref:hypothetical protein n=1 Tax=Tissierella sp. P1 TaxID=1280483 RepID=UPI000BA0A77B|nr:hypothetical protein [Tissierella sp. P1]OZV12307.1 hypothetical protein CIW83_09415 [Tissierella sp. P1]